MIIDGEGQVLGRLASSVAELAQSGERVRVVNAEKAVITGRRKKILDRYKEKYDRGDKDNGPHFPRRPDRILRRTIRGMLPQSKASGREAFDRVKVYVGIPREFEGEERNRFEDASLRSGVHVELGEVSSHLGSNF
ncbi:MAG: 50S ribosomal protein L13 [Methanonatronarchaeales archaeon]|nr:50S ribosomal protein L13 [Methanonatronarchaeales archaeon]